MHCLVVHLCWWFVLLLQRSIFVGATTAGSSNHRSDQKDPRKDNEEDETEKTFDRLHLPNITVISGDGSTGLEAQAPFDRIILTAAAEDPPANLLAQLKENGIMVLPVGQSNATQTLIKITKTSDGLDYEELEEVRFVPLVAGKA